MIGSSSSVLIILAALLTVPWCYVRKKYSYFRDRGILHDKPTFPLGNIGTLKVFEECFSWGYHLYLKFRGQDVLCGMFMGLAPCIVITDLDVISDVLVRDFKTFSDHNHLIHEEKCQDPLGPSLYSMRGELWRHMRTKMSAAYSSAFIGGMFDMAQHCANNLNDFVHRQVDMSPGEPINMQDISLRYLCDALGSCGFGIDCRGMVDEDPVLLKIAHRVFNPSGTEVLLYAFFYPFLADWWPSYLLNKDTKEFLNIIDETVRYREENQIRRNDILQVLLDINRNGSVVDDESGELLGKAQPHGLHAEAFLLFFFSYHSTRNTLSAAFYEIAANPTIQNRVREEIFRIISETDTFDYAAVEKMVYLQQIVDGKQTLIFIASPYSTK